MHVKLDVGRDRRQTKTQTDMQTADRETGRHADRLTDIIDI